MSMYNLLTNHEIDMMDYYIKNYGPREDYVEPSASMEHLMRFWDRGKSEYLNRIFKDNLILEKTISFEKDIEEIQDEIRVKVIDRYCSDSAKECEDFLRAWDELGFELGQKDSEVCWTLQRLVQSNSLASNRYDYNNYDIPLPGEKKYRVSRGCKVSKAIGKIANAYKLSGYETFRIYHSQVLNEKSVSGTLCISIHPLDYMTMSDNDCGWGSCMSWYDHGDYRQGTVEMMNSPMVVVAYLKSSTDYCINGSKEYFWNSKRWRELFVVNENVIAGIKGYPYWNESLELATIDWLTELATEANIGKYREDIIHYSGRNNNFYIGDEVHDLHFHTRLMYNDFYCENHNMRISETNNIPTDIEYSGISECLCCGNELYDFNSEADLFCLNCEDVYQCYECGEYHSRDDLIEVNGNLYCRWCYEEYFSVCEGCGEEVHINDTMSVFLGLDKNHIWQDKEINICYYCFKHDNELFEAKDLQELKLSRWQTIDFITPDALTQKGLETFGFNSVEEAYEFESRHAPFKVFEETTF